ncbi:MAG: class C sortase [Oscillospiraceae bacterium]|nr:class C sortase [Oscillospiraceae bacterium]
MRKRKVSVSTVILVIVFLAGLSVMLYPIISDYWNSKTQSRVIADYDELLSSMDNDTCNALMESAKDYNDKLKDLYNPLENYNEITGYDDALDVTGTGIMGYVTIPEIEVELPIYHGTSDKVLNNAAGHLQGTSLPIGGENTHSVISAHRGLPSAKLFSDLDELEKGDRFTITVLNEVLTYEVDKIQIIEPDELDKLEIVDGQDYVTLITCTPYGINTHRLLVRGNRVATESKLSVRVSADAVKIEPILVAPFVAIPILIIFLIVMLGIDKNKKTDGGEDNEKT